MASAKKQAKKRGPSGPPPLAIGANDPLGAWDRLGRADPAKPNMSGEKMGRRKGQV